jgi:hypothetical protein
MIAEIVWTGKRGATGSVILILGIIMIRMKAELIYLWWWDT